VKAVILAGGKGTRMAELAREIPKPMLKIGNKPILAHQVSLLKKYGITKIHILVNHLKEPIIEYFSKNNVGGVEIAFFTEPEPLGTVGGVKEIEHELQQDFLVIYGDVMINMDLGRLIRYHRKKKSGCTLVLHPNDHPYDSDLVETDTEGRVCGFHSKPHQTDRFYPNMVNAGAYIFTPAIFQFLEKGKKADFGRDIFPRIFSQINMYGYNTAEYLKDMGTPERWKEVESDYQSGRIERSCYKQKQKAIFLDRDGVINEEISFISKPQDMRLYPFTAEALKLINRSDYKAIIVTNQSVIARNLCTFGELKNIHNKMETELGNSRAMVDAIYICPHHPDRGYPEERSELKIECLCRKPKPGMLFEAALDFNLDLSASFIIGDNERDIKAGLSAGCTTVGVMTGYGLRRTSVLPDFFFNDLKEAAGFIINEPYLSVYEEITSRKLPSPAILLVGGKARSGKSILSAYLKWKFERIGKKVLTIGLDNWIIPEDRRENCRNVYDRFQLPRIENDIQQILAGMKISLNQYLSHPDRLTQQIIYEYSGQDIIIIEGVVALSSEVLRNLASLTVYVDIHPELQRSRIQKLYRWRGKSEDEIEKLYNERLSDEYNLIEKELKLANLVVNSDKE
jgi:histidinol-phosphate phosphatase family protein